MMNRIEALRRSRNLTQEALARKVAVSRQTIIAIEKGKFSPSLPLAFRLAAVFDCRIEDAFTPDREQTGPAGVAEL
jgi:putative transcriptional regulator